MVRGPTTRNTAKTTNVSCQEFSQATHGLPGYDQGLTIHQSQKDKKKKKKRLNKGKIVAQQQSLSPKSTTEPPRAAHSVPTGPGSLTGRPIGLRHHQSPKFTDEESGKFIVATIA
ncbi:hypothetical protein L3X38_004256 [Prunus dulcis]|uniref:Uncharacterized protein n=1 Tax=Prunus dulcis TaxID=3755 RepID=A0AAD5F330_PRUDU|nr:hypothetical protein L3X38_004256 [Prunus dulcis]